MTQMSNLSFNFTSVVLENISKKKQIMNEIVKNFKENIEETSKFLIKKHNEELLKVLKIKQQRFEGQSPQVSFKMKRLYSKD